MRKVVERENKAFGGSLQTYGENKERVLRKTTILELIESSKFRPKIRRDRRGGLNKLKDMIYFLREYYAEAQLIPYDDVEYAIIMVSQGLDPRTIRKYLQQLLKFHYLEHKGSPLSEVSQVIVKTDRRTFPKSYYSKKGHRNYVFGFMAPKRYDDPSLEEISQGQGSSLPESSPPHSPPSENDERVAVLLEKAGVSLEKCVCDSREPGGSKEAPGERVSIEREERENTVSHTYRLGESILGPQKLQPELTAGELRSLKTVKGEGPG